MARDVGGNEERPCDKRSFNPSSESTTEEERAHDNSRRNKQKKK